MMSWEKLVKPERLGRRAAKTEPSRSPFNSDHDKIIFSGAFRRLARKTQVHPLATNDHVHNRLTHSLEVACVGRSLGISVGQKLTDAKKLPASFTAADLGDIVQATCLAHDIGNPPFGHTGESAIRSWFSKDGATLIGKMTPEEQCDLRTFEGNAQGFRILSTSEYHPYDGGMRLTYATLASSMKYPWTSLPAASNKRPKTEKFGVFRSELVLFHEVAQAVGLLAQAGDDWYCRHPFVALLEAADDFCYGLLDLEDGLEMGIIGWDEVYRLMSALLRKEELDAVKTDLEHRRPVRRPPLLRGKVIDACVSAAAAAFIRHEDRLLAGEYVDLVSVCDQDVKAFVQAAKNLARSQIFTHPRKIELEIGSYSVMATLLDVICSALLEYCHAPQDCSFKTTRVIDLIGTNTLPTDEQVARIPGVTREYLAVMRGIDFISGCTDHYATYLAKQFNGMGEVR